MPLYQSTFNPAADLALTADQSVSVDTLFGSLTEDILTLNHTTSGTPANGLGTGIVLSAETSSGNVARQISEIVAVWTDITTASRTGKVLIRVVNSAILGSQFTVFGSGGVSVNSASDPGAGILNANSGFRIANAATSGNVLRGNGTDFVSAQLNYSDLTGTNPAVATTTTLTINGLAQTLAADRTWTGNIQSPVANLTILDGYSFDIARRYVVTGSLKLTVQGNGVFMVT